MEENNKRSFNYIFTNVIWYHYKWAIVVSVFLVAAIIFTIFEIRQKIDYDFNLAVVVGSEISSENSEFEQAVADAVGDINGDGEVNINVQYLLMEDAEWGSGNQERVFLYFSDEDYFLFITDDYYSQLYSGAEYFDSLDDYGFETDSDYPTRVKLTENVDEFDIDLYASIVDWTTVDKGSEAALQATLSVIDALS